MVNETQVVFGSIVCCVLLFVAIILFAVSWSVLDPLEMGLNRNDLAKSLERESYDSGRYFLGLGHSFVKYPRDLIIIDFSTDADSGGPPLQAGTADGQSITLEVSLYYRLKFDQLYNLYSKFEEKYEPQLIRIAQSTIKNTAVKFSTEDYFSNRNDIRELMKEDLIKAFSEQAFAEVHFIQLRGMGLPQQFEDRLIDLEVVVQEQTKAVFDKEVAIVEAQTQVIEAAAQGQITEILGQAKADSLLIREQGVANGTSLIVGIETETYDLLREELGFTNEQLQNYLFYTRKLSTAKANDRLLVGLAGGGDASVLVGSN